MAVSAIDSAAGGLDPSGGLGSSSGLGSGGSTGSPPGMDTQQNQADALNQINANSAQTLAFQQQTRAAMALWQTRIAVDNKCWDLLNQVIQSLMR